MQNNITELTEELIHQIAYYQSVKKGTFTVEQFIHYRGLTKTQIEIGTNKLIADRVHAKSIAINLPHNYFAINIQR